MLNGCNLCFFTGVTIGVCLFFGVCVGQQPSNAKVKLVKLNHENDDEMFHMTKRWQYIYYKSAQA